MTHTRKLVADAGYDAEDFDGGTLTIMDPGKFEGENADVLFWYDLAMEGCGTAIYDSDDEEAQIAGEYFEVSAEDMTCLANPDGVSVGMYAILWYSDSGFVSLEYRDKCPE